jgi:glutamine cyclotransferase
MSIVNNKIYWLTWQARKGFVYDLDTFKQINEFNYNRSNEGWGLTHGNDELIKSDGSNKIWFLDTKDQKEKRAIQAYTNKVSLKSLNELEWINGKIYANYWQKPLIAIINPDHGIVEGIINLTQLVKEMEKTQKLVDQDDVLNGIAFDKENNRLFVTGKHWSKLFEIELVKK